MVLEVSRVLTFGLGVYVQLLDRNTKKPPAVAIRLSLLI